MQQMGNANYGGTGQGMGKQPGKSVFRKQFYRKQALPLCDTMTVEVENGKIKLSSLHLTDSMDISDTLIALPDTR